MGRTALLPQRLTSEMYRNFSTKTLPVFLKFLGLFTSHFNLVAHKFLAATNEDGWIGRGKPHV